MLLRTCIRRIYGDFRFYSSESIRLVSCLRFVRWLNIEKFELPKIMRKMTVLDAMLLKVHTYLRVGPHAFNFNLVFDYSSTYLNFVVLLVRVGS